MGVAVNSRDIGLRAISFTDFAQVVSTDVGGVPEVLPPSMIRLCPPNAEKFVEAVSETISEDVPYRDRWDQHQKVCH